MRILQLTNQRFGRLIAIEPSRLKHRTAWFCECDCGNRVIVATYRLRDETTRSCGCLKKDVVSERVVIRNTVHGHNIVGSRTGTHKSWSAMMSRCNCQSDGSYPEYSGRGITVCDRWKTYVNFLNDMGERPANHSIERIDVGNYTPDNCKWATRSEQQKNKRCHKC